jgi:hypothetical protein
MLLCRVVLKLSVVMLNVFYECHDTVMLAIVNAECHLYCLSFMLISLCCVIMLNDIMPNVIMLNVFILSVAAPSCATLQLC